MTDTAPSTAPRETHGFQAEVKQLLDLMIHSLYSNREIFLRELISNASDACDKLRFEALDDPALFENDAALAIRADYDADARTITVRASGQPVDCDARGSYRVCVASQNIGMVVGKQPNCTLADVSPEGMAVITNAPLHVGGETEIDLSIEGIYARGVLAVVSERKLDGGKFRYGLRAGGDKKSPMRRSLEAVSNLLHRRQVQRLARAA